MEGADGFFIGRLRRCSSLAARPLSAASQMARRRGVANVAVMMTDGQVLSYGVKSPLRMVMN